MKKKILVTGSNGYIGTYLVKKLKKKYDILKFDRHNIDSLFANSSNVFKKNIYAIIFAHGQDSVAMSSNQNLKNSFIDEKEILSYLNINLILNLKIINQYMKFCKNGRVINFSSIYSMRSPKHYIYKKNYTKNIGYSISKAASNIALKWLGNKFGKNFLFNSIILGGVEKKNLEKFFLNNYLKHNPLNRMIKLKEIIPIINFLLDEKNTYTNSQNIILDGGHTSW